MRKVLLAALALGLLGLRLWLRSERARVRDSQAVVLPIPESDLRTARMLSAKVSEDVSSLLTRPRLPRAVVNREPVEAVEWAIDITPSRPGAVFKRGEISLALGHKWFKSEFPEGHADLFGRLAANQQWKIALTIGVPETYDQLALGVRLISDSGHPATEVELERLARVIEGEAKQIGGVMRPRKTPKAAAGQARALAALRAEFGDAPATVVLAAPQGTRYDGRAIWDVMHGLGLRWRETDWFYWENEDGAIGDVYLFRVRSSTPPGHFLPEDVAADQVHVEDLVFDFSIPRTGEPAAVLEGMLAAATYAQKRLGGELRDGAGAKLDIGGLRWRVADVSARLTSAGFPPCSDATLMLF